MGTTPSTTGGKPLFTSPYRADTGESVLTVFRLPDLSFHFQYEDGTRFVVNPSGTEIWAAWPPELTPEDAAVYLLGPIFGFVLRMRGTVSLHASGVVIGDTAIALLGHAGAGKSTTAAAFSLLGYRVLTDDVCALVDQSGAFSMLPGYPGLRLWPDSVTNLLGSPDALPPLTPTWDKRQLPLSHFETEPVPLSAIYVLGQRSDAGAYVEAFSGSGMLTLLSNSYGFYLLDGPMRAHEFDVLSRLAGSVPIRRAKASSDPARLREFCAALVADALRPRN